MNKPGCVELPLGVTVRELVDKHAGGVWKRSPVVVEVFPVHGADDSQNSSWALDFTSYTSQPLQTGAAFLPWSKGRR